jgi:serine phosphatase RsbU (regulator of sigma subunit)
VAITDGVTDATAVGRERFGMRRLQETPAHMQNDSTMSILERLGERIEGFQVGAQADDTAVVVMRFNGPLAAVPAANEQGEGIWGVGARQSG